MTRLLWQAFWVENEAETYRNPLKSIERQRIQWSSSSCFWLPGTNEHETLAFDHVFPPKTSHGVALKWQKYAKVNNKEGIQKLYVICIIA